MSDKKNNNNKKKEYVTIQTQNVSIKNSGNNSKNKRKRKPKNNNNKDSVVPVGVQSGLSEFHEVFRERSELPEGCTHFSEQARSFILGYIDPCGEHVRSLDAARVPDGTLDVSSPGFIRDVDTLVLPFQSGEDILLNSKVYSMLGLQFPLMRALIIVLVDREGKEFDSAVMNQFIKTFSNIVKKENHFYPNWTGYSITGSFTVIDTGPLREITPPTESGVSSTIDSYRFSGMGFDIFYNTPDLINQGTLATMRYPVDQSLKVLLETSPLTGASPVYLRYSWVRTGESTFSLFINIDPLNPVQGLPAFSGPVTVDEGDLGDAFLAVGNYRNATGTFTINDGDAVIYRIASQEVTIYNITNDQFLGLFAISTSATLGIVYIGSERIYETSGPTNISVQNKEIITIGLPPVTQAAIFQNNPKAFIELSKEDGGSYQTGRIYQPVFNVTHSSTYTKVVFANSETDLADISNDAPGWEDTVDQNFSVQIANYQSIPYACKPMFKIARTMELIPGEASILSLTTTGCPPKERGAIDFCVAFSEAQPHGYPTDYNSLGILFSKVVRAVELLPRLLRSGENIAEVVTGAVEEVRSSGLLRGKRRTNHRMMG
jgi:hypothetical protein